MKLDTIGKNIRMYRTIAQLRQEDLAAKTGLTPNYIGMIERGEKIPSLETFITIANALETTTDRLLFDVLTAGYMVKESLLSQKIDMLTKKDRERVYAVVDTLVLHSAKKSH